MKRLGAASEQWIDGRQQLLRGERLHQDGRAAGGDAILLHLIRIMSGQRDERGRIVFDEEWADDLEPAAVGQREVEQHEVGTLGPRDAQCLADRSGDAHPMTGRLQEEPQCVPRELVVFDEKNVIGH
jgi:hypothetical protein